MTFIHSLSIHYTCMDILLGQVLELVGVGGWSWGVGGGGGGGGVAVREVLARRGAADFLEPIFF